MKIAIMGYGTVGSGVAEVLDKNADIICKRLGGEPLEIKRILPSWQEEGMRSRRLFRIDRAIRIMNTEESAEVLRNLKTLILSRMEAEHGN